jgi:uncharacterized protein YndB with AHSA1/START domain
MLFKINRRQAVAGIVAAALAATGVMLAATPADASADCGTVDVDRNAQVIVDLSIVIDAPLPVVWRLQTDIDRWPTWQQNVTEATLSGPLAVGSTFHWQTHGLPVDSTITEIHPQRRIVWGGPALGIDGVHVWTFTPTRHGVRVHTTESWDGPPIAVDPEAAKATLTGSLNAWLADLKTTAESAR